MDDALRLHALSAAKAVALHQQGGIAEPAQAGVEPEAGDAAADDEDIGAQGLGHGNAPSGNERRSITEPATGSVVESMLLSSDGSGAHSTAGARTAASITPFDAPKPSGYPSLP